MKSISVSAEGRWTPEQTPRCLRRVGSRPCFLGRLPTSFSMHISGSRSQLLTRIGVAHASGLWVAGMVGTIPADTGFDVFGGALAGTIGGLMSVPWVAALGLLVWLRPSWISDHPVAFALVGPVLVCGSWAAFAGLTMLDSVAISSVASSVFWVAMLFIPAWRLAAVRLADRAAPRNVR